MAVADSSVRYMTWQQAGAPSLTGQNGSLVALLDALLVNGFGVASPTSVAVAGNVCTIAYAGSHSYIKDGVIRVSGVTTPAALNGDWKVKSVTATALTFDTVGIPDQTATGAVSTKVCPVGWSKVQTAANVGCYKSADVTACGQILRVADSTTTLARVNGYESMSDANTGTGIFPSATQFSGGLYWLKSATADATARPWIMLGDSKIFYLWIATGYFAGTQTNLGEVVSFGEGLKTLSTDRYCTMLNGGRDTAGQAQTSYYFLTRVSPGYTSPSTYAARAAENLGSSVAISNGANTDLSGSPVYCFPYPNFDGKIRAFLVPARYSDTNSTTRNLNKERMWYPGMYCTDIGCANYFNTFDPVTNVVGTLSGRSVIALRCDSPNQSTQAVIFADVSGPWR